LIGIEAVFTTDGYKETILELAPERRNTRVGTVTGGCVVKSAEKRARESVC